MDGIAYENMPVKKTKHVSTKLTKKLALQDFNSLSTGTILWALVKRHKYGLAVNAFVLENVYIGAKFLGVL